MRECRAWFRAGWRTMPKVRRKLNHRQRPQETTLMVWFEVPDPGFATWISVKYSLQVQSDAKYMAAK